MKLDLSEYMTVAEAAKALGTNRRAVYRAAGRAAEEGHECMVTILGRALVPKKMFQTLRNYYFPAGSDRRAAMAEQWGRRGGEAKRDNAVKRAATSRRSSRGTSGTAAEGR